jgi:hypothetical protein
VCAKIQIPALPKHTDTCKNSIFLTVEKLLDRLGERSVTDGGDEDDFKGALQSFFSRNATFSIAYIFLLLSLLDMRMHASSGVWKYSYSWILHVRYSQTNLCGFPT